jgi:methyltransferase (TIGR00027 family)
MKNNNPSWSAEFVTIYRAAESLRPADQRICYDPYAKYFLRPKFKLNITEQRSPGAIGTVVARVRFIDDCLRKRIDEGIRQLVILGAGFDTRAYRFEQLKETDAIFELDHPATQKIKMEKVRRLFDPFPDHVAYVPIDFKSDSLEDKLEKYGYDKDLKTFFIWEGVTMYMTEKAVNKILAFVTMNSGKGSSIVFDYVFRSVVNGTYEQAYVKKMLDSRAKTDEPWIFGLEQELVEKFILDRGFDQVHHTSAESLRKAYFKGRNLNRKVFPFWGFVHAMVNE